MRRLYDFNQYVQRFAGFSPLLVIVVAGACVILAGVVPQFRSIYYLYRIVPLVKDEAEKIPGVSVTRIYDMGPPDEVNVEVTLTIEGKGTLALTSPYPNSFTGGGDIFIRKIGDCWTNFSSPPKPPYQFYAVAEVIESYDEIYTSVLLASISGDPSAPRCEITTTFYMDNEFPSIETQVAHTPNISIQEVKQSQYHVYITFAIENKDVFTLDTPASEGIADREPVYLTAIGDCELLFNKRFSSYTKLIENYAQIYAQVRADAVGENKYRTKCKNADTP
jgi:hypothetical protein